MVESRPDPYSRLRQICDEDANSVIFRFLSAGPGEMGSLTRRELLAAASHLARRFGEHCRPGDRVLLLFPAGLSFPAAFYACVAGGFVAIPAPPPMAGREKRAAGRLRSIVRDAAPSLLVSGTPGDDGDPLEVLFGLEPALAALPRLRVDVAAILEDSGTDPRPHEPGGAPQDVLCLQYTSGSTAAPKGVMVGRDALWHNSEMIRRAWGYGPDSRSVVWVPNFHDDGLVQGIVQPVHSGFPCSLMSPLELIRRPARWLEAMSAEAATHGGGPNFAYELCLRKVSEEEKEGLDLSPWRVAYNAAEPVRHDTLRRFHEAFRKQGFRMRTFHPSFGLAEATLLVTTGSADEAPPAVLADVAALELEQRLVEREAPEGDGGGATPGAATPRGRSREVRALVGCGAPVEWTRVAIVDSESRLELDDGEVGEVWVDSPSLALGYWRRPGASAETFRAYLAGSGDGPFLRTGDLGFLRGGELYVTGRAKDLVILRGRNIYPQDVELTVERCHPGVRPGCTAAFALEIGGDESLAVVVEVVGDEAELTAGGGQEVVDTLRQSVAEEHELPLAVVSLIRPRSLPKTSSGKLQRRETRRMLLAGELAELYRWRAPGAAPADRLASAPQDVPAPPAPGPARPPAAPSVEIPTETLDWLRRDLPRMADLALADSRRALPAHLLPALAGRGLFGMQAPRSLGGLELSHRAAGRVYRQLGATDLTLASLVSAHNTLGLAPILRHRPGAVGDSLLADLVAGRRVAAFALTEPEAGSNPRAMACLAEATEGGWRLSGDKAWIGSVTWAGVMVTFARHADGPHAGSVSAFVVGRDMEGVHPGPEIPTVGLRAMVQGRLRLEAVEVVPEHLLGEAGAGLGVAREALAGARLALASIALGALERCARLTAEFASRRSIATGRLLNHPVTRLRWAGMTASAQALAALVDRLVTIRDGGDEVVEELTMAAKVAGSELLWRAADDTVQTLGSRGYDDGSEVARLWRDARAYRIVEGPTEALTAFLGARLHHAADELLGRLTELSGQREPAERLRRAAEELLADDAPSPYGDPLDVRRWAYHQLGLLWTDAVLWSAAAAGEGAAWAAQRFDARLGEARGSAASAAWVGGGGAGATAAVEAEAATTGSPVPPASPGPDTPAVPPPAEGEPEAAEQIAAWMRRWIAGRQGLEAEAVEDHRAFEFYGLDSVTSVSLVEELAGWLGRSLPPTLVWRYPSIGSLSRHLASSGG